MTRAGLRGLRAALTGAAYLGGWRVVRALPEPLAGRTFDAGALLAARRGGRGVQRLAGNLARATGVPPGPALDELVEAGLRSYARYWREAFRLPGLGTEAVLAGTSVPNWPACRQVLDAGRGLLFALPHMGNWDMAGAWLVAQGVPFTTVAERLEPASVFDAFVAFRESIGMQVLALTGARRPPLDVLTERLAAGGCVCLLADRDLSRHGVEVQLFGGASRMPPGPAVLAQRTGAALHPVTPWFTDDGWVLDVHDEVPVAPGPDGVATATQAMADAFAAGIAAHPTDWHMLQPLWLDDLSPDDPRRRRHTPDRPGAQQGNGPPGVAP